jgi:hypothetical protein
VTDFYNHRERFRSKHVELLNTIPRRLLPLQTSELGSELDKGPIPVLILRRPLDSFRFLLTTTIVALMILIPVTIPTVLNSDHPGMRILRSSFLTVFYMAVIILLLENPPSSRKPSKRKLIFEIVFLSTSFIGNLFMVDIYDIWLAAFIVSVEVVISLRRRSLNRASDIHGCCLTIFLCVRVLESSIG